MGCSLSTPAISDVLYNKWSFYSGSKEHELLPTLYKFQKLFCLFILMVLSPALGGFFSRYVQVSTQPKNGRKLSLNFFLCTVPFSLALGSINPSHHDISELWSLSLSLPLSKTAIFLWVPPSCVTAWKWPLGNKLFQSQGPPPLFTSSQGSRLCVACFSMFWKPFVSYLLFCFLVVSGERLNSVSVTPSWKESLLILEISYY